MPDRTKLCFCSEKRLETLASISSIHRRCIIQIYGNFVPSFMEMPFRPHSLTLILFCDCSSERKFLSLVTISFILIMQVPSSGSHRSVDFIDFLLFLNASSIEERGKKGRVLNRRRGQKRKKYKKGLKASRAKNIRMKMK